jgi:hypothetical protein
MFKDEIILEKISKTSTQSVIEWWWLFSFRLRTVRLIDSFTANMKYMYLNQL